MGFEIYDIDGKHVDSFTSAGGLDALAKAVAKKPRRWILFNQFLNKGSGYVTRDLLNEIEDFIRFQEPKSKRRSVRFMTWNIAKDLLVILRRTKQYAIISI